MLQGTHLLLFILIICVLPVTTAWSLAPASCDLLHAHNWVQTQFGGQPAGLHESDSKFNQFSSEPPFSFIYNGKSSSDLLKTWKKEISTQKLDGKRIQHTLIFLDPVTGLQVKCKGVEYKDFPTVEWTVYFRNTGFKDTPILENIKGLDSTFIRGQEGEFLLHHDRGTSVRADDFEPLTTPLLPKSELTLTPQGGRPCGQASPYFNLEWGNEGVITAVGWPGKWSAEFTRDSDRKIHVTAGQEHTHLQLHPGEEIRTPLIVLQFWTGDYLTSQNLWRRWMVAHNIPRINGKISSPQLTPCSSHQYGEMINANEENQKMFIDRYLEEKIQIDYWWMDAGWYVNDGTWFNTGTWEVDPQRFPLGLRAVSDYAHTKKIKTIVWFEPERVNGKNWLSENHPEWILGGNLLNLGNKDAWNWLVNHVDHLITEQGIDLYRQDYNIDPLSFWRDNDAPNRQGITENHYVTGYLSYWDELKKRYPNMMIDSCASGGHRNDLETMRRAIPLLRSDYIFEPIGQQNHTYGLSFWLPWFGTGTWAENAYDFRSCMCPGQIGCWDMRRKDLNYDFLRRMTREWREVAPNYFGDYYPLTPFNAGDNVWMAWQFDRPENGEGTVQIFRRPNSKDDSAHLKLKGLLPESHYILKNLDQTSSFELTGKELMSEGLSVHITEAPSAQVITYKMAR